MTDATPTTTQAPAAAEPVVAATPAAATTAPVLTPGDPAAGFKSEESKAAVLADLARERDARQALEARLDAFSQALGGNATADKPEDLAETVKNLQAQFAASQLEATKLRIAAEKNIPAEYHDLLTETDPEKLSAQAEKVGALVAANAAANATPEFQANPGQGQGGGAASPEAIAEAEYRQYHPLPSRK